jgi:hypothetical protein
LHHALRDLGFDSVVTTNGADPRRRWIVLGADLIPFVKNVVLPPDAILYNLEQIGAGGAPTHPGVWPLFRSHTVWDYSACNVAEFERLGVCVERIVPIGYVRELTRITPAAKDIDVLFFGSMNLRRARIVRALRELGLTVRAVFGIYGPGRDALIARSRLVLNVHFYESKVLEMVRISYLLANQCAVLSEPGAYAPDNETVAGGVAFANYADLAVRARALIDDPAELAAIAQRGFDIMSGRRMQDYLQAALLPARAA